MIRSDLILVSVLATLASASCAVSSSSGDAGPVRLAGTGGMTATATPVGSAAGADGGGSGSASTTPAAPAATQVPTETPTPLPTTFILLRSGSVTPDARLNFVGQGFKPGEAIAVTVEDEQGDTEAKLSPIVANKDGRIDEVSLPVPAGLNPGEHAIHVTGTLSGRSARTAFRLQWLAPKVELASYTAKAEHSFSFVGRGFTPGEVVEVHLGGLGGTPLTTFTADAQGMVTGRNVPLPLIRGGDYPLYFVGRQSQTPVSVGFNVQGFTPWVVLDNYAPPPYYKMGVSGEDFAPNEPVQVYLDTRVGNPIVTLEASAQGKIRLKQVIELPALRGPHTLIFVAQQTGSEYKADFIAQPFTPSLELSVYAGRPGTPVSLVGAKWEHNETVRAYMGDKNRKMVATFQADASGSFRNAGSFKVPIGVAAGGVPVTVVGDSSQATTTIWFQVLEVKPSAELTAYKGPSGTTVAFTGRAFAGGERVIVHLRDAGGPVLAEATTNDAGAFEHVGSYTVTGPPGGDALPFVLVGQDSGAKATTHFKITRPGLAG